MTKKNKWEKIIEEENNKEDIENFGKRILERFEEDYKKLPFSVRFFMSKKDIAQMMYMSGCLNVMTEIVNEHKKIVGGKQNESKR